MRGTVDEKVVVQFGDVMRSWMKYARLSAGEVAEQLGISRASVSVMLNGRMRDGERTIYDPPMSMLLQFSNVAGVSASVILQIMTGDLPLTMETWRSASMERMLDTMAQQNPGLDREAMKELLYRLDEDYDRLASSPVVPDFFKR